MVKYLFLVFISTSLSAKAGYIDYYNAVNEGEYHLFEGQYDMAIANFNMAFTMVPKPKARDYYLATKCYSQLNLETEMLAHLELAVLGGLDKDFIIADSLWFTNYRHTMAFKTIEELDPVQIGLPENKAAEKAYKALKKKVSLIKVMKFYRLYDTKDSLAEPYNAYLVKYQPYQDSMQKMLLNFYFDHPMPTAPDKLNFLQLVCMTFLTHDMPELEKLEKYFIQEIDKGTITPLYFASIFDNPFNEQEKKLQYLPSNYGMEEAVIPPNEVDKILAKRKAIGLSIYYQYAPNYSQNHKPNLIADMIRTYEYEILD